MRFLARTRAGFAVAVLGFTAIVTQIIVLREFLSVFCSNELVIGIVLANWMILTGIGSLLARYVKIMQQAGRPVIVGSLLEAVLPLLTVFLLHTLRNVVFSVGSMVGIVESFLSSFILLIPFCLLSGFLFTYLAGLISHHRGSAGVPFVYSIEAAGSVLGGLLFNGLMVFLLSTFQALYVLALINLVVGFVFSAGRGRVVLPAVIVVLGGAAAIAPFTVDADRAAKQSLFRDQNLLYYRDTPYGDLAVTAQGDQHNFYENATLLFSTNDHAANEEAVHYAMLQRARPRAVLLVSGGISGTLDEILKYAIDRVDYVEINPWLLEIGSNYTGTLNDPRVRIINDDGRRFLRDASVKYDAVLVNVPDPASALINRYYTEEFLRDVKAALTPGGVVSLSLLPATEYQGAEARRVSSSVMATLRSSFRNVIIIPGNRNYYLASDDALSPRIADLVAQRGIDNVYVNPYYLDDRMLEERSRELSGGLDPAAHVNTDFMPVTYHAQLAYWLSYYRLSPWLIGAVIAALFVLMAVRLDTVSLGLFTGGFAASSIEILLLVAFQAIYGSVFRATGAIVTSFMAGLAVGAWLGRRSPPASGMRRFTGLQLAIAAYAFLLPGALVLLKERSSADGINVGVFLVLALVTGVLVGLEFAAASVVKRGTAISVASTLYGIDLIGSALGALVVCTYLVPLLGIPYASYVVALVVLISASAALTHGRHFPGGIIWRTRHG